MDSAAINRNLIDLRESTERIATALESLLEVQYRLHPETRPPAKD